MFGPARIAAALAVLLPAAAAAPAQTHSSAPTAVETIPLDMSGPRPIAQLAIGSGAPVRGHFRYGRVR